MTETDVGTDTAAAACPSCGSGDVAQILYGYPHFDGGLDRDLRAGRVVLGGCVVRSGIATHRCNACEQSFGHLSLRHWSLPDDAETVD